MKRMMSSLASNASFARPTTAMSFGVESTWLNVDRTKGESSTMRTLMDPLCFTSDSQPPIPDYSYHRDHRERRVLLRKKLQRNPSEFRVDTVYMHVITRRFAKFFSIISL